MSDLITVVVPVYNMEKYLYRFMNTLLSQTCDGFEVIIVDDGSSDNSIEMCNEYEQRFPELIKVIHKENGGLSSARNTGIEAAKGSFIIFPDPDDWLEQDYVKKLMSIQKEYSPDLVCVGHYIEFDHKTVLANEGATFVTMNQKCALHSLFETPTISGFAWNKLYRMDIIKKNRLFFLDDVGTKEDLDFAYRYLKYCDKICFAPNERVYHYYQRTGAATHSGFSRKKIDSFHVYEKIIDDTDDDYLKYRVKLEICNSAINTIWIYKNSSVDDKEAYSIIKDYLNRYLNIYLKSSDIPFGRKIQAILARISPNAYCLLKNSFTKA